MLVSGVFKYYLSLFHIQITMRAKNYTSLKHYFVNNSYKYTNSSFNGYLIQFGNSYLGYLIPINKFSPFHWLSCLRWSILNSDVSLYLNGTLIRSAINTNVKCTTKNAEYPYKIKKYGN